MKSMSFLLLVSFFVLYISLTLETTCKVYETVPTYFSRKDKNGKLIDATNMSKWFNINTQRPLLANSNQTRTASLEIKPSIVKNGHDVTISWKGIQKPRTEDFIAMYCPEDAKNNDYIDYINVQDSPTYKQGKGERIVQLTNLRTNCQFRYFKNISPGHHQELAATSNIVMFEGGPEMPLQIHLALTGDPTQMRVMWVSGTDATPVVKFGTDIEHQESVVEGKSQTYKASDLCAVRGMFIDPGYIHDVLLTGLKSSSVYYYSCGVPGHMSAVRSFKTAPPVGSDVSYKFIVYGDMGVQPAAYNTVKHVLNDVKNGCEFIFHNGDISYARGMEYIWDQWHSLIQPYSSIAPYMVGIGNHEQDHVDDSSKDPSGVTGDGFHPWWGTYDDDSNGECGVPMFYRFHMPDNGNYLWWYSYDYGSVHFIMMSTEHDMGQGSRQYAWLEKDLKNVDRSKTPWIILGGHRPMYTSEAEPSSIVSVGMQVLFEDLLHEYKVDLALWAHYHSYERTCALYKNECIKGGTIHIVTGTAGKESEGAPFSPSSWSLYRRLKDSYGYGRVTVANRSALHWEYFVNSEEKVVDDVWMVKEKPVSSNSVVFY